MSEPVTSPPWWVAIKGSARWAMCAKVDGSSSADKCRECEDLRVNCVPGVGYYGTCGKFLHETERNCGCIVLAAKRADVETGVDLTCRDAIIERFRAVATPAGKTTCAGEGCPQGKWSVG